jgi:hypothetical protein
MGSFLKRDRHLNFLITTENRYRDPFAGLMPVNHRAQFGGCVYFLVIERNNDIAAGKDLAAPIDADLCGFDSGKGRRRSL